MLWLSPVGWDPRDCASLKERYGEGAIAVYSAGETIPAVGETLSAIYWVAAGRAPGEEELEANEAAASADSYHTPHPLDERLSAICTQVGRGEIFLSLSSSGATWDEIDLGGHRRGYTDEETLSVRPSEQGRPGDFWEIQIDCSRTFRGKRFSFMNFIEGGQRIGMSYARDELRRWVRELLHNPRYFRRPHEALNEQHPSEWGCY
jgi:hypothetical protein